MKITKKEVDLFYELIADSAISLSEARKRDAIVKQLVKFGREYAYDRMKIIKEFCEKKDDELIVKDNNYLVINGKEEEFNKEMDTLNNEEVEIELDAQSTKKIIENTKYTPKVGEMDLIDNLIAKI